MCSSPGGSSGRSFDEDRRCGAPRRSRRARCSCSRRGMRQQLEVVVVADDQHDRRRPGQHPAPARLEGHQERGDPARVRGRVGHAPGASGASGASGATADTIPLATEDPQTKFFGALSTFSVVPQGPRREVHRRPRREATRSSPTNDPNYIKALSTCAAKSNILQALKDYGTFQDNLTPAQIKVQNKGYLAWRECMIGRGWGIPEPKPDSKGRLFSFSTSGGRSGSAVPNFTPPPGRGHHDEQ